ncbi:MAG: hypothetical protein A2Y40_06720 [Candidatus Margulisbacteria bacterium GWF2_35_9]|nr:MAG: hypothetical protein A2Y40_06720 [Candidatus Margulisbacteria bacterium GWF2_35_9]
MNTINNSQSVTSSTSTNSSADETSSIDLTSSGSSIDSSYSSSLSLIKELTGSDNPETINEEQLYTSLIYDRISATKGETAAEKFKELLEEALKENTRDDGYTYVEIAASEALSKMADTEYLTLEEAETINSQAFQAAQLDDNTSELWDSRGDTKSTATTESAIENALKMMSQFESGELESGRLAFTTVELTDTNTDTTTGTTTGKSVSSDDSMYSNSAEYTSYGTRNGGRQAWRIPDCGTEFGGSLKIVFEDGHTVYVNNTSENYREDDGFVFKPGISDGGEGHGSTSTSHNGVFLHAPYGNTSQTAKIYWN